MKQAMPPSLRVGVPTSKTINSGREKISLSGRSTACFGVFSTVGDFITAAAGAAPVQRLARLPGHRLEVLHHALEFGVLLDLALQGRLHRLALDLGFAPGQRVDQRHQFRPGAAFVADFKRRVTTMAQISYIQKCW